jgi:hypothetical protein
VNLIKVIKSRTIIFLIQISILVIAISIFEYKYELNLQLFPKPYETSEEQIVIIEWLVNFIMYKNLKDTIFIYTIWLIISMVPVLIYYDYKKVYSMNLLTFFFSNFFFYSFLYNYYLPYFNAKFLILFIKTILLGIVIIFFSVGISLIIIVFKKPKSKTQLEDLHHIAELIKSKCPQCGTEFNSNALFCYNCNYELKIGDKN